ncbi:MAG TPA: hypothetical protein VFE79_26075 [Paraburkholderia sp.]|nr:hypothetical protein [Paraburkholderia sp.]
MKQLTSDEVAAFELEHAAAIQVACAALPTDIARKAVDSNRVSCHARPLEIWSVDEVQFAFVWVTKENDSRPPKTLRHIGVVSISPSDGVGFETTARAASIVGKALDYQLVCFADQFWSGRQPLSTRSERAGSRFFDPAARVLRNAGGSFAAREIGSTERPMGSTADAADGSSLVRDAEVFLDKALEAWLARSSTSRSGSTKGGEPPRATGSQGGEPHPLSLLPVKGDAAGAVDFMRNWAVVENLDQLSAALRKRNVVNFTLDTQKKDEYRVTAIALPFYPGFSLYCIGDKRGARVRSTYLITDHDGTDACLLDSRTRAIYAFNARMERAGNLNLCRETAVHYLKFFCRFTYGNDGAFSVIEDWSELRWLPDVLYRSDEELNTNQKKESSLFQSVKNGVSPIKLYAVDAPDSPEPTTEVRHFYCSAFCCYGRNLFLSLFSVATSGIVQMVEDRPLWEELPIKPIDFNEEYGFALRSASSIFPREAT